MRVPTYDNPQVMPTVQPSPRMDAPAMPDVAGRQAQDQGQMMQQASAGIGRIAVDMQHEANQLRVIRASNEAKEQMFNLLYDKDNGAFNQKGWNALNRESGKDLSTEYTERFDEVTGKIADSLGNDAQRLAFRQQADSMRTQMYGETQRHLSSEFKTFKVSELDGSVSTAKREIALVGASGNIAQLPDGTNNLDNAIARITAATKEKARMLGLSQEQADVFARKEISDAHALAIGDAIKSGKTNYAISYFEKYKGQMDAPDVLHIQEKIDHVATTTVALEAVSKAEQRLAPAFAPDGVTRIHGIVQMLESSGRRYGADGKLLESPKGAKGEMQVLDSTNTDPGYGVTPARDNSPEERARVGRDYIAAMVKRYGNVPQALAAYNAGPGTVDAAIAKAKNPKNETGGDWFYHLNNDARSAKAREETRKYVERGMKLYGAGEGAPPKPTEKDFVDSALAALGPNPRPEAVKLATLEAQRRFDLNDKAIKQRDEENYVEMQRLLIANNGNYAGLPMDGIMKLSPDKREKLEKFSSEVRKGPPVETEWGTYYALSQKPADELASINLMGYRGKLADAQFKELSSRQAMIGKRDDAAIAKDKNMMEAMKQIEGSLTDSGIFLKATEKQPGLLKTRDEFLGQVRSIINDEQVATGKPVSVERAKQVAAQLLTKVAADPEASFFKGNDAAWKVMSKAFDDIPESQRESIIADIRKNGQEPTRTLVVEAWKKRIMARANTEIQKGNKL